MIFIDQTSVYKNLLKVNQVGKKMAPHSNYIISNGILIAYSKQEMGDTEANPVSVGFIDDKIYKKLEGIGDNIGIKINGEDLYKTSQEYDFDSIEYDENGLKVIFKQNGEIAYLSGKFSNEVIEKIGYNVNEVKNTKTYLEELSKSLEKEVIPDVNSIGYITTRDSEYKYPIMYVGTSNYLFLDENNELFILKN